MCINLVSPQNYFVQINFKKSLKFFSVFTLQLTRKDRNVHKCRAQAQLIYRKNALFSIKLYGCNTRVWVEIKNSLRQSYIQLPNIVFKILQCPNKANQCIAMSSYYIHTCNIWHMSPECNTYYVHIFLNQTSTKVLLGYHKPSIETFSAVQL